MVNIEKMMDQLPEQAKQEVLDFIDFIIQKYSMNEDLILTENEKEFLDIAEKEYNSIKTKKSNINNKFYFSNSVERFLAKQTLKIKNQIKEKIKILSEKYPETEGFDLKKNAKFEGIFSLNIDKIRILIKLLKEDNILLVFKIGFRGDIYK